MLLRTWQPYKNGDSFSCFWMNHCCCVFFFAAEQDFQYVGSMEVPLAEDPSNMIKFSYHSTAQMINILKTTEERCPEIARTYSIGRSMEGRELLVIEFSNNPGNHGLREF